MLYNANENEKEILEFWDKNKIFEKSVEQRPEDKPYVFYDGPPFATGLPHYGHILGSVIKDVVPRYWTMKGYRVRRRWGWDCHGMPIENIIEKDLNISGKKDIEEKVGVEEFNNACGSKVLKYAQEWKQMINRIGRWVEFDNSYKTMDSTYMESVWWGLKNIWDKGLIYEGRKVLMYCPRCETPVSKAEIAMDNSYRDITEESVTVKFEVKNDQKNKVLDETLINNNLYILAWTTTPWTLPGNVALAVGEDIDYIICEAEEVGTLYILAKDRIEDAMKDKKYKIIKEIKGKDLVSLEYNPLFEIIEVKNSGKKAWYVTEADFVNTEDGTGVVHTAAIYGEDDYSLSQKLDLPMVPTLDEKGNFNNEAPEFIRGQYFKKAERFIKKDLEERGLLFKKENYTHSYPHCWRCETQLFYNAISAWFINVQKIKKRLIELNEKISWYPEHLKHGRFLNILETAPDWNISRNRYWATPLPFWKCGSEDCDQVECIGSVADLKEKSVNFSEVYNTDEVEKMDLHKHNMDKIKVKCSKCNSEMTRIPEVIDCWVESSSMPFAEFHYPFENKEVFEARFPGQYIGEYIGQVRAWFYYMHVMAVALFDNVSYENCVVTGNILNDKGEKLSKSKQNYTDPWEIINQYGVDTLRYYLMTNVVMHAEDLFFKDQEVKDAYGKVLNMLWNVFEFYEMYSSSYKLEALSHKSDNVLDKWVLAKLQVLVKEVSEHMDNYNTVKAGRPIKEFISDLSQWYVRRSRDRFKIGGEEDKATAITTLREVLLTLSKLMAPFTPFIAEKIYLDVGGEKESVHLEDWPKVDDKKIDDTMIKDMGVARKIVEMGLSLRSEQSLKVRQPLNQLIVLGSKLPDDLLEIIASELNVKQVNIEDKKINDKFIVKEEGELKVGLDIEITEELKKEGLVREIVRAVNQIRKEKKLSIDKKAIVTFQTDHELLNIVFKEYADELKKNTVTSVFENGDGEVEKKINGSVVRLSVVEV